MKILFVNDNLRGGGKERRLVQLICNLAKDPDYEIHVAIFERKSSVSWLSGEDDIRKFVDYPEIFESGAKIHFVERSQKKDFGLFLKFWKLVREVRPEVINIWTVMGCVYAIPVSLSLGIPLISSFVADCNGPRRWTKWWWIVNAAIWRSRLITGNSLAGLSAYRIPTSKAVAIYNGFNFDRLRGIAPRNEVLHSLGLPSGIRVVTMAARFDAFKDYDTFLSAARILLDKNSDLAFVCLGQGDGLERCRSLVEQRHRDRVLFPGFRRDAEAVLAASSVTVLCTNDSVHREGVSNSILESMAAGVPVVATGRGGTLEIVEDGRSGILIEPADVQGLVESLSRILEDEALRAEMGARSRTIVEEKFSIDSMVRNFQDVFEKERRR